MLLPISLLVLGSLSMGGGGTKSQPPAGGLVAVVSAPASKKKMAAKIAKAPRSLEMFDPSLERLPVGFAGYDFGALFDVRRAAPQKGDFETTEHYRDRLKALGRDGYYAVALDLYSKYDADHQRFTFMVTTSKLETEAAMRFGSLTNNRPVIVVKQTRKEGRKYLASNAFGVKSQVTRLHMSEDAVVLVHSFSEEAPSLFYLNLPPDRASAVSLAFVLVFKVDSDTDVATASREEAPTIGSPFAVTTAYRYITAGDAAIWAYDKKTGEVFGKVRTGLVRLPVYPGATLVAAEHFNTPNETEETFSTYDPMDKVLSYYLAELPKIGLIATLEKHNFEEIGSVVADSLDKKRHVRILVTKDSTKTSIIHQERHDD